MNKADGNNAGDENQHSGMSARDAELAQRIAQTLDASTTAFDADTRAHLAMLRHRVLARTRKQRIATFALAASVLALVAMPWMLHQQPQQKITDEAAYLSVDPEMLADMDMLEAIGEVPGEPR